MYLIKNQTLNFLARYLDCYKRINGLSKNLRNEYEINKCHC
ncbi:hypothetical protein VCRA2121O65_100018 [Vibrio crassostreae]|nr:hypothetical protein VCRA2116O26_100018 [Vibrio crassostreae]CAK1707355.1 hypothetical protein VCRA2117O38_100147 [Vibrio crassostreae]CAK1712787.1 hypothetical protein VCRA2113O22_110018 [Vibrio crassostreae]CAK1735393.1 hypothetical protein VCRA2110O135_120066 [Vibrio crassostreae]CAK1797490.1 hypothetical protein VCRA2116O31_160018 [Vibrio crassostreae]